MTNSESSLLAGPGKRIETAETRYNLSSSEISLYLFDQYYWVQTIMSTLTIDKLILIN